MLVPARDGGADGPPERGSVPPSGRLGKTGGPFGFGRPRVDGPRPPRVEVSPLVPMLGGAPGDDEEPGREPAPTAPRGREAVPKGRFGFGGVGPELESALVFTGGQRPAQSR